jgi:hypothetical protein
MEMGQPEIMRSKSDYSQLVTVLFLIVAVALRFVPHPANFAPLGALGLFAGCYLRGWGAWLLPVGAVAASDWLGHLLNIPGMGFYSPIGMAFVYGGFAIGALIGRFLRGRERPLPVAGAAFLNSLAFFVISNFGVWFASVSFYEKSLTGLVECYVSAIPFFGNSLAGDIFYSALFFGAYQLVLRMIPAEKPEAVKVRDR